MTEFLMPKFGLTMTEGLLLEWHVETGAPFKAGDMLFTVETEKVATEVEAEADGILSEILVPAGDTVPVGVPVGMLAGGATKPKAQPATDTQDSPSARKLMTEHGVQRSQIEATGRDGRVMKEDVLRLVATPLAKRIAAQTGVDLHQISGTGPKGRIKANDVTSAAPAAQPVDGVTETTPDATRLATARLVTAAKRDIPHFYVTHEAELSKLMALRDDLNEEGASARISVTHMLIRALGLALTEMPQMNRIWLDDKILAFEQANIGMVVETPNGLRIPVIRDAGQQNLDDVATQAKGLVQRAVEGKLAAADVGNGVISISNVGMFGVSSLIPIINPPNAMILGVGADRAVFRPAPDGSPVLACELTLTLACDHRIIDGADAARFLSVLVNILETPVRLLRPARLLNS